jgi:hypothetical protein
MPATSLARSFFDSIVKAADPVAAIRALVNLENPTFETDWLDFKTEHRDPKRNDPKIREAKYKEQLLEAISGFANNAGGVLIWGIKADKPKDGPQIDAANEEVPVSDAKAVEARLMQLRGLAADPPLPNVEIKGYEHPDKPGTGFVVCFVPEGGFKPYRTNDGNASQFYLRSGDTFSVMSRSLIQSMFYPRPLAKFQVDVDMHVERNSRSDNKWLFFLDIYLTNKGTSSARQPKVLLVDRNGSNGPPERIVPSIGWAKLDPFIVTSESLHPSMPPQRAVTWRALIPAGDSDAYRVGHLMPIWFEVSVFAKDQEPRYFVVRPSEHNEMRTLKTLGNFSLTARQVGSFSDDES